MSATCHLVSGSPYGVGELLVQGQASKVVVVRISASGSRRDLHVLVNGMTVVHSKRAGIQTAHIPAAIIE